MKVKYFNDFREIRSYMRRFFTPSDLNLSPYNKKPSAKKMMPKMNESGFILLSSPVIRSPVLKNNEESIIKIFNK